MHGAVLAARVRAGLPILPIRSFPELRPIPSEAFADQVTGALPAARRERHRAPGRAVVLTLPSGELQVHRRRAQREALGQLQYVSEFALDLLASEEDVLLHRLVVITGRKQQAVYAEAGQE